MGSFIIDADDGNTPVLHENTIYRDSVKNTVFNRLGLMGKPNSGKPIVVDTNLQGKAGEDVKLHFTPYADVEPIVGQSISIEGNENEIAEFTDTVRVDSVNYPFRRDGDMTVQRTILRIREELRGQIATHAAQHNDREGFKRLSGVPQSEKKSSYTAAANTTDRVQGDTRCMRAVGSNSSIVVAAASTDATALNAAMTSADKLSPKAIMSLQVTARDQTEVSPYRLQSMMSKNGQEWYIFLGAPGSIFDLKLHPEWFTRAVMASERGLDNDPIALGAVGTINNVIIHEAEHTLTFTDAADSTLKFARNLLLGQNACVFGFAKHLNYVERDFNYGKSMGVNGEQIRGEKKLAFENKNDSTQNIDFGVMQFISAANVN